MGVLVVIDERELEHAPMRQDEDAGLVHELVLRDPHGGSHRAVGPLLRLSDAAASEYST
jgi:hypothetical protein